MGLIQFSRRWDRQPPTGVGHSRAWAQRGMVALFDCRSGVELISGARASVDGLQRLASKDGSAADFSSTANMRWAHRAAFAQTGPMSIMVLCDVDALSGYGALIAKQGTTTTNAPYELRLGVSPTDSKLNLLRANASSFGNRALPSDVISAGSRGVALCLSFSGRDPIGFAYIKGGSDVTSGGLFAGTGAGDVTDNGADVWIGRRYDGATQLDGRIYYIALFNRAVTQSEAVEWSANKWSLYEPRRVWVPVSAGGGLTAVTSDAPLAWTVRNAVQKDQALAYTLRSGIQADRSLSWALRAGVHTDQSLAWTVRNAVQRDQALAYTLRNAVQADRSLSWSLRNATQGDAPLAWIVRSSVLRDQTLAYGVRGTAQKDQSLAWSVVAKVQKDQSLAWSVASTGTVISDQPLSWLVRSTTQRDQALAYPVRAAVQSDKPLAWSVRSTVQSDKAITWSVRNAVQRDRTLAYSILAAAQHDQSLSWLVRSRVQHDQPLAWVMRSGIQQDQPLAFPIRGATQQDRPLSWSVLTSAVADASLSWIMRAGVSRYQGIAYQVYSIAQRDQALAWTVASSVVLPAVICITVEPFYAFQQSEIVDVWRLNGSIEPVLRGCDS